MIDPRMPRWQHWAQFRFAVIGGLLSSPPESGQLQQELQALAEKSYQHPLVPDKRISPSFSTIERWYYQAKDAPDPITALGQKLRADAGRRLAIGEPLKAAIKSQYHAYPRWTVQLHYDNLVALAGQQPQLTPLPSYKTVLRCFHQAKIKLLEESGKWHHPIALAILDDRSRLCCHLQFYLAETAECLVHGLTQAIMKRGLPRALMTDNGSAMLAEETSQGLLRLGVVHETTLPYSPYQNGKQEVFWAQLEGRLIEMLRGIENLKLAFINHAAQAWVEQDYHRNQHREIGATPLQRMLDGPDVGRRAPIPCAWPLPARSSAPPAAVTPPSWSRAYATKCPRDSVTCTRLRCARQVGTKAR